MTKLNSNELAALALAIRHGDYDDDISNVRLLQEWSAERIQLVETARRAEREPVYVVTGPSRINNERVLVDRRNRKSWSVTMIETGQRWRISPTWLTPEEAA
jgi:hypothetical protein